MEEVLGSIWLCLDVQDYSFEYLWGKELFRRIILAIEYEQNPSLWEVLKRRIFVGGFWENILEKSEVFFFLFKEGWILDANNNLRWPKFFPQSFKARTLAVGN